MLYAAANNSIVWPAGGDRVTAVHVDGGLHAVLSGVVLVDTATPVGKSAHAVQFFCYSWFLCVKFSTESFLGFFATLDEISSESQ